MEITCEHCGKVFHTDPTAESAFCVFCGGRQSLSPRTILEMDKDESGQDAAIARFRNHLVKCTDPEERLRLIKEASVLSAQEKEAYERLWALRYSPSRLKGLKYADKWLGIYQIILSISKDGRSKAVNKKAQKELKSLFGEVKKDDLFDTNDLPTANDFKSRDLWKRWPKLRPLFDELVNITFLYTYLCMKDKTYGSIAFGIGRKKDETIASMISEELVKMELHALHPARDYEGMVELFIHSLHDGYRLYFDPKFLI